MEGHAPSCPIFAGADGAAPSRGWNYRTVTLQEPERP